MALERRITVTPTFVLAEDGREVGRIVGYPGNSFFWELLGELLRRVPKAPAAPPGNQPEPASLCAVRRPVEDGRRHVISRRSQME